MYRVKHLWIGYYMLCINTVSNLIRQFIFITNSFIIFPFREHSYYFDTINVLCSTV